VKLPRILSGPAALSLLAGIATAFAHPPFGILPGILGYGLLFAVVDRTDGERPLRSAFWRAWLAGVGYFAIGCWWVAEAFMVDAAEQGWMAPIAVVLLAAGLGLFWGLGGLLYRMLRPRDTILKALVFAGALSLLEWTRGHVFTGFPWNLPGETWRAGSPPSQAAALVGAYGLTWITLLAMAALAAPFAFGFRRSTWSLLSGGIAVVIALYGYGFWHLSHGDGPTPGPVIRVVQPDVRQEAKYDASKFVDIVSRYLRLTAQPTASGLSPDIVIWPEGAIPAAANDVLNPNLGIYPAVVKALKPGQILLMGTYRLDERAVKPTYYNSLYALRRDGDDLKVLGIYDKYRLVPFGEYGLQSDEGDRLPEAGPRGGGRVQFGPPSESDADRGLRPGAGPDLLREPVPGFRAWRRAQVRRAAGVDRQCLQRRLVWPDLRALAASQPRQLPRHRGRHSDGPRYADRRLGCDRRRGPTAQDPRPRQVGRDRRGPAGGAPASDRLRPVWRERVLDHDRPVGCRADSCGPRASPSSKRSSGRLSRLRI
jgi:apolipoprotein N-acyltransferase